ncbi:hypothetical protein [Pseudogracilibacillus sp. SO30301A]|uniref:hypothetical protein n=1 Tax=Pseudogracilibacillus sp. SO30301A TaxID=3098291 RepID=UPI00300E0B8F
MKISRQLLLFMIIIVMGGCGNVITEDQLIGGTWLVTNGYEDGEIGGDPMCPPFNEGLEFIDEENVYVIAEKEEFVYSLRESDEGMKIEFYNPNGEMDFFKITLENENGFGLNGSGMIKTRNCYFEREE